MIALLLLACATPDKTTDTANLSDTSVAEDTANTGETGDTSETDDTGETGDTDETSDTGDTNDGPPIVNTDFPELQEEFDGIYNTAIPAPLLDMDMGNTTVYAGYLISLAPLIELQFTAGTVGQENITCPTIDGEFPAEGAPTEDITVTGGGCTNDDGKTYNGSFVYGPEGVEFNAYAVTSPAEDENCQGMFTTSTTDGGVRIGANTEPMPFLVKMQSENLDENCDPIPSTSYLNGVLTADDSVEEETLVNGELLFLMASDAYSMWFMAITEDEVLNSSVCESEPISGTNTMTNGTDEMVYTFDGATDCDEEPTQMLSINGGAPEEVAGSSCATTSVRTGLMAVLFAFGLTVFRRREDNNA